MAESWVPVGERSDFTLANLPFGVAVRPGQDHAGAFVAIGEQAVDLHALHQRGLLGDWDLPPDVFAGGSLNPMLDCGPDAWRAVRRRVAELLHAGNDELRSPGDEVLAEVLVARGDLTMRLPVRIGDYVDLYSGIHHATNVGRILRPDGDPLAPNWRSLPVGYHGRAGTVVVSGTDVVRPRGQVLVDGRPEHRESRMLDFELEVGFVVGTGTSLGEPIAVDRALDHVFGLVLLDDWSARDIQAWESQPLGPFLAKSFATSISPWVVTLDALEPYLVPGLAADQEPAPPAYLRSSRPAIPELHLEASLQTSAMSVAGQDPQVVASAEFAEAMYWSMAQQLAHSTVNGASVRPGDLFGSGTVSGPDPATQGGSMIELTWLGERPIDVGGETRSFLEDGDRVTMRGWCGGDGRPRVGFGELTGTVRPAGA